MSSKVLNRCVESIYLNTSLKIKVFSSFLNMKRLNCTYMIRHLYDKCVVINVWKRLKNAIKSRTIHSFRYCI